MLQVKKGDRNCSSAVCEAWELALRGTDYELDITRYNSTFSMRRVFLESGLFSWEPMSFNASRGDAYLDEACHTAMCIQNDGTADLLGEFSISETGGIDGEPGDQTGRESSVHGRRAGVPVRRGRPGATGYYEALYRVHWMGSSPGWGKWEHDDDDGGAGNDRDQIDMIELTIAPC